MGNCSNTFCDNGWETVIEGYGYTVCLKCNPEGKIKFNAKKKEYKKVERKGFTIDGFGEDF